MSSGNTGENGKGAGWKIWQNLSLLGHGRHRNIFQPRSAVLIPAAGRVHVIGCPFIFVSFAVLLSHVSTYTISSSLGYEHLMTTSRGQDSCRHGCCVSLGDRCSRGWLGESGLWVGKTIFITDRSKNRPTPWLGPISQRHPDGNPESSESDRLCKMRGQRAPSLQILLDKQDLGSVFTPVKAPRDPAGFWGTCAEGYGCGQDHFHMFSPKIQPPAHPSLAAHRESSPKKAEREI